MVEEEPVREARGHDLAWAGVSELPPDELVHALLSTVGCVDRGAHRAAHTALQRALQRDGTQPALVSEALLTALRRVSGRALGQQPAHAALRWTALLAPHVDPSTPLFACLAGVQSVLLLTLTTGKPRGRRLRLPFALLLRSAPQLVDAYLTVLKQQLEKPTAQACALAGALVDHALGLAVTDASSSATRDSCINLAVELYAKVVISATTAPTPSAALAVGNALAHATAAQVEQALLPALSRALRRNPEVAVSVVAPLLAQLRIDLTSQHAAEVMPPLLQIVWSPKEDVRSFAGRALFELAVRTAGAAGGAKPVVDAIRALLGGSEGRLKDVFQRTGLLSALAGLAAVPGAKALAHDVVVYLTAYVKEEMQDDARLAALGALSAWLPLATDVASACPAQFFGDGLKSKDVFRRAHLRVLLSCADAEIAPVVAPVVGPLSELVRSSLTKPSQRWEGMAALTVLARASTLENVVSRALEESKFWAAVWMSNSALLRAPAVAKMPTDEAKLGSDLAECLLSAHMAQLQRATGAVQCTARLLTLLMLHPVRGLSRHAAAACERVVRCSGELAAAALVSAVDEWLSVQDATGGLFTRSDDGDAVVALPGTVAAAILRLTSPALRSHVPQLVLLAHRRDADHAREFSAGVARAADDVRFWRCVLRKLQAQTPADASSLIDAQSAALVDALMGSRGLASESSVEKAAALRAIRTLAATEQQFAFGVLLPPLLQLADRSEHDTFSAADVAVFYTPEGQLSTDQGKGVYVAQVSVVDSRRKARGRFKMYDDDDDEEPSAVKPPPKPAATKSAKDEKKDPRELARLQQLKDESELRARMMRVKQRLEASLAGIASLADGNAGAAQLHLSALSASVLPLLSSTLVGVGAAFCTARRLAACCAWPTRSISPDVTATALRLCLDPGMSAEAATSSAVQRVVQHLSSQCAYAALPAPTYRFCFPLLQRVLLLPVATPLHAACFGVVAKHVDSSEANNEVLLPVETVKIIFHMLDAGTVPTHAHVAPLLSRCCATLTTEEGVSVALDGLLCAASVTRTAALAALPSIPALQQALTNPALLARLYIATHDPDAANAAIAATLWADCGLELPPGYGIELLPYLASPSATVRVAAAHTVASAMTTHPQMAQQTLARLFAFYSDCRAAEGRAAAIEVLQLAVAALTSRDLPVVSTFLIRVLSDDDDAVRSAAVAGGVAMIDAHGSAHVGALLPIFENYINNQAKGVGPRDGMGDADEQQRDYVRAGVVVLLGALAKHMEKDDPKVRTIVQRLVEILATPSEAVQRSVSDCLPPLMASLTEDERRALIQQLQTELTAGRRYGDRRGAAFGLAGVVKGLGISALKAYGIVDALKAAVEDKASAPAREGALLAFECLCTKLGRLFEPYVIHILPLLLSCFGDSSVGVREATEGAANAIMAQLSGQGVKLVLPGLLKGVEDKQWRTKQGSVQLLGAMAHCAPKQLTACLPTIVPRLAETLTDTHPKVAAAARSALLEVGSVIRNPEISALVPCIMDAIIDPNEKTNSCLDTLLETTFVNSVDAPSLALIVPIINRGLRERKTDLKKKAAKIAGNMCSLVGSSADMAPYVPLLLPELKRALVDPIPEVRAIAARALASLMQGMGEAHFPDLVPWLQQTLQSDASGVERSGAAQGLAEVLSVLDAAHLDALLPHITDGCSSSRAAVREGYLTLTRFLPGTLGSAFEPHLPAVLPCVLGGLSDEAEGVRDAAMGAGRVIVERYARTALPLLLPAVEAGISAESWRIRQSSVELLGELLFKVAGASGKIQTDTGSDDESVSTEAQGRALLEALGEKRKAEVLSAVYLARSDVGLTVRNTALHVWKSLVVNTPRTLGEILPVLMQRIIASLAASVPDQRTGASRCLGELVRKLAERVLPTVVPILQSGLSHPDSNTRQGVCLGLSEVLNSATRVQLASYYGRLIPTVQQALCDESPAVRVAAGAAFNQLFRGGGGSDASSEIVPALLSSLEGDLNALEGLKQVLKAQPRLLSSVLPRLAAPPLTAFSAHALGALSEVSGTALPPHLPVLMPPLLVACSSEDAAIAQAARIASEAIVLAVDSDSIGDVVGELLRGLEDSAPGCRAAAANLAGFFFKAAQADLEEHLPVILGALIVQLVDTDPGAVRAAWTALGDVTSVLPKDSLHLYVRCVRDAVSCARDKERRRIRGSDASVLIAGFCLPKGLQPILPIYLQSILAGGSPEVREASGEAIGELVALTSEEALKPHIISITGPLIRVVSDKVQWQVKAAILQALGVIISKGGAALKPFLPQLQTTFVKCLSDAARTVRMRAAHALGLLMQLQTRLDPLCTELLNGLVAVETDTSVREALMVALCEVIKQAGAHITPPTLGRIVAVLQQDLGALGEDGTAAKTDAFGAAAILLDAAEFDALMVALLTTASAGDARLQRAAALCAILKLAPARVLASSASAQLAPTLHSLAEDARAEVRVVAVRMSGLLVLHDPSAATASVEHLARSVQDESSDVRRQALYALKHIAKTLRAAAFAPHLAVLLPPAAEALNDRVGPVKLLAERAVRRCCFSTQPASLDAAQALVLAAGGPALRAKLTDAVLRRLSKLQDDSDGEGAL